MEKMIKLWHHICMIKNNKRHTVGDTLEEGRNILKNARIDTFDIDCRVLLSYVSGMKHYELISKPKTEIPQKLYNHYMRLIKRRSKFEPIAQITKEKEFWSLPFKVSKGTLIPRPDSETLIEAVKSEFKDTEKCYRILDMGTGSGCLLLSLLSEYKNAIGFGIDVKCNALKTAKENSKKLGLNPRARIIKLNWKNKKPTTKFGPEKFHIIISNPPYIRASEMKTLDPDVQKYEPRKALYGGRDGLDEYRQISKALYYWDILDDDGKLFLEFGKGQQEDVKKIFEAFGFKFKKYFTDLGGITRVIELSKK